MKRVRRIWVLLPAVALLLLLPAGMPALAADPPFVSKTEVFVAAPDGLPRLAEQEDGDGALQMTVQPGSTVYFGIENAQRAENLEGLRAAVDWTRGRDQADEPRIEYREMFSADGNTSLGYRFVVSLRVRATANAYSHTLRGAVQISERLNSVAPQTKFTIAVRSEGAPTKERVLRCTAARMPFDLQGADEKLTVFYYDRGYFSVEMQHQRMVDIGASIEEFTDIRQRYPEAQLQFLSWRRMPFFDHTGQLVLYAESGSCLYELLGDRLEDCTDSYSEADQAFMLSRRRLTAYVISDRPLSMQTPMQPLPNPPVGAQAQ